MGQTLDRAVAFVDLAGFTALTEAHGDVEAADLAERFTDLARVALDPGDRLVKAIGDAVLLTAPDPAAGVDRVVTACYAAPGFPVPRSGLHHGPVVDRNGDVFGATVNLAARIAGQASGGQTLGTAGIGRRRPVPGDRRRQHRVIELRNLSVPIELFQLRLGPSAVTGAVDPVCRMLVSQATAAGHLHHSGTDYYFCSLRCAAAFATEPERFASR